MDGRGGTNGPWNVTGALTLVLRDETHRFGGQIAQLLCSLTYLESFRPLNMESKAVICFSVSHLLSDTTCGPLVTE
jgi:hypothetical protein